MRDSTAAMRGLRAASLCVLAAAVTALGAPSPFAANLTVRGPAPAAIPGMPPSSSPVGVSLSVDSGGFRRDGVPWLDISGELHYARVPRAAWAPRLRRMRAGGLTTVASYVFWIHHEEAEGELDWSGGRDLRAFVQEAARAGLLVSLRIGPYGHGEVRNGGLPDWVLAKPGIQVRSAQAEWMAYAVAWYGNVSAQLAGLYWAAGGPIITVQLDNEESNAAYLVALRGAAVAAGIAPPFFVATGLNKVPTGSMLPFSGRYVAPFWDCGDPGTYNFLFRAPDYLGSGYPTLYCELGGGMASVYSCRHNMAPSDVGAAALVTMAATNGLGYYMYGGGINPRGARTTLQERQKEAGSCDCYNGYWGLPVAAYDFVAPLSLAGSPHGQYHFLRNLHSLAADPALGAWLPPTASYLPEATPGSPGDLTTLRWQARGDGASASALLFINNYQRGAALANHSGVRLALALPGRTAPLLVPAAASPAANIPSGAAFIWPVFPPLAASAGGLALAYALAQLLGTVETAAGPVLLFAGSPGVPAELCFEGAAGLEVLLCAGACAVEGDELFARALPAGRGAALTVRTAGGAVISFVVLDEAAGAERVWFGELAGQRRAFLGDATDDSAMLEFDAEGAGAPLLRLVAEGAAAAVSILPPPAALAPAGGGAPLVGVPDGLFTRYVVPLPPPAADVAAAATGPAASVPPPVAKGSHGNAVLPGDDGSSAGGWAAAAAWALSFSPAGYVAGNDTELILAIDWEGDAARLLTSAAADAGYADLLNDALYNAPASAAQLWETPLTALLGPALPQQLTLRILPLREDAQAAIGIDVWPATGTGPSAPGVNTSLRLVGVTLKRRITTTLVATAEAAAATAAATPASVMYKNPIGPANTGDPGAAWDPASRRFYFSITGERNFPIYSSADLATWEAAGDVFDAATMPAWIETDMWAPEFHFVAGAWNVYYAARNRNGTLCVGVARSTNATSILGPYADRGSELVYTLGMGNIDPSFFLDDDGTQYLLYKTDGNGASPHVPTPIWAVPLAADGMALAAGASRTQLLTNNASTWERSIIEAPWMIKHGGWYYLFYSGAGGASYAVGVARAPSVLGPFVKHGAPLLHTNSTSKPFQGAGHCSVITDPATGALAMMYHVWMGGPRYVTLDAVAWTADSPPWPFVADGSTYPSSVELPVP